MNFSEEITISKWWWLKYYALFAQIGIIKNKH